MGREGEDQRESDGMREGQIERDWMRGDQKREVV